MGLIRSKTQGETGGGGGADLKALTGCETGNNTKSTQNRPTNVSISLHLFLVCTWLPRARGSQSVWSREEGWFCSPEDIWWCLEAFLVVPTWGGGCCHWNLVARGYVKGCSLPYSAQGSPATKDYLVPNASSAEAEQPCLAWEGFTWTGGHLLSLGTAVRGVRSLWACGNLPCGNRTKEKCWDVLRIWWNGFKLSLEPHEKN